MHLPEFILLVIATVAAIAAGLAMATSNYRVARIFFWIAALSFASLGVVWAAQSEGYSLRTQIAVATICFAIAFAGLLWGLKEVRGRAEGQESQKTSAEKGGKNNPNINAGGDVHIGHIGDVNISPPELHVLPEQRSIFLKKISRSGTKIGIRLQDGSNQGRIFFHDVAELFQSAGWQVVGTDAANTLPGNHHGLVLEVGNPMPSEAKKISDALKMAGIVHEIIRGPWPDGMPDVFRLVVWPAR